MLRLKEIFILILIWSLSFQFVSAISNVRHSVEGNRITITYEGTPPFLVNIRGDTNIGQVGGYIWAKTYLNSFSYDTSFANNPSKQFYYGIKDTGWSSTNDFLITSSQESYQCWGIVADGLCHGTTDYTPIIRQNSYEDSNLKIWGSNYPSKIQVGQEFNLSVYMKNKLTTNYTLMDVSHEIPSTYFQIISSQLSSEYKVKHYSINFNPGELKQFNMTLRAIKENLFTGNVFFGLGIANALNTEFVSFETKVEANSDYILCGGIKFPRTFHDDSVMAYSFYSSDYTNAKCCNNVFYPSFECCLDSDCSSGRCVDGICISHIFQGFSGVKDPAIGNKKVLIILSSNTAETDRLPCNNKIMDYQYIADGVGDFYDAQARNYLNESQDFINFNWTIIGNINIQELGLNGEVIPDEIIDRFTQLCGLNKYLYDEIVVYNPEQFLWCSYAGACAGRPILTKSFNDQTLVGILNHELAHNFGCRDLYTIGGGTLQWSGSLMSYQEGENATSDALLDVCRGEMGWVDLDGNGIIDVVDFKNPTQIKINYSSTSIDQRSKGTYILFEGLGVFGQIDNLWWPFATAQKSIIIERNGVEEFSCGGTETCAPVFSTDTIILRAEYSYIDTSVGRLIRLFDETKIPVSRLIQ